MSKTITIAIADTDPLRLKQLKTKLLLLTGIQVVFETAALTELVDHLKKQSTEIVLINLESLKNAGADFLNTFQSEMSQTKIILTATHINVVSFWRYVSQGINGFISMKNTKKEILQTIQMVQDLGYFCMTQNLLDNAQEVDSEALFSDREAAIIKGICQEQTSKEIAANLHLSKRTIDWYRSAIMKRIGTQSSLGVIKYAIQHNIYSLP